MTEDERIELAKELLEADVDTPEGFYWDENGDLQEYGEEGPEYKYVLGLDPGGTTGVAMLRYTDESQPELIYLHQIENGGRGFKDWFNGSELDGDVDVASEVWEEHNVKGADRTPLFIQGIMFAIWDEPENLHYQSPKLKSLVPDEWLKEQNLWTTGRRHQMDALIHALVFLRNNGHRPTQKSLTGLSKKKLANEGEAESKEVDEGEDAQPSEDMSEGLKKLAEAFKEIAEASKKTAEAVEEFADEGGEGDSAEGGGGQPTGVADEDGEATGDFAGNFEREGDVPAEWHNPEIKGERKRKERNGVFAGFETEDDEGTVLFSD
jgi:hypothetical protein